MPKAKRKQRSTATTTARTVAQKSDNSFLATQQAVHRYPTVWTPPKEIPDSFSNGGLRYEKKLDTAPLNGEYLTEEERIALREITSHATYEEWRKRRVEQLGATDVVKVVGLGYSDKPIEFAYQCLGLRYSEHVDLRGYQNMSMGTYLEPFALEHYRTETGFSVQTTGYHAMPPFVCKESFTLTAIAHRRAPWLGAYLQSLGGEGSKQYWRALTALDIPYLVVTPDSLVDMQPAIEEERARTNSLTNTHANVHERIPARFFDMEKYYRTGVVEVKTHVNGLRSPQQNKAAVVQMLAQMLCVELEEDDCTDGALIRTKWADLCSYSCVTSLSNVFHATVARRTPVPLQRCAAWRVSVIDVGIAVDLAEMVRHFRESLDTLRCAEESNDKETPYRMATQPDPWKSLRLTDRLQYERIFNIETDREPQIHME